jgi:hypothetical protein
MVRRCCLFTLCLLGGLGGLSPAGAQEAPGPFRDALLDDLVGTWTMQGQVRGDSVTYRADAAWVLGYQFLRLQMRDVATPPQYAAHVYVGYDSTAEAYVAHWLDDTGGRASKTLGTGSRDGDTLAFRFDYPSGPFRTVFERRAPDRWRVRMRTKGDDGTWQPFATYVLTPRTDP